VQAKNPESGTIKYSYDDSGNLATRTDPRIVSGTMNYKVTMSYDGMNRLTQKSYNDSGITPTAKFLYDEGGAVANANGRLTTVTAGGGLTFTRGYDIVGRVNSSSQFTGGTTYSMGYGYDYAGEQTSFTYPVTGRVLTTSFDIAGRASGLSGVLGPTTIYASSVGYFPNGALASLGLGPQALVQQYCQNNRLQITGVRLGPAAGRRPPIAPTAGRIR